MISVAAAPTEYFRFSATEFHQGIDDLEFSEQKLPGFFRYNRTINTCRGSFNLEVLEICRKVAYAAAEADFKGLQLSSEYSFLMEKVLSKVLVKEDDTVVIERTLSTHVCRSAMEYSQLSEDTIKLLIQKAASIVGADLFFGLQDYSFLTEEIAKIVFRSHSYCRPFLLDAFWSSASDRMVVFTLRMFAFDLHGLEISKYISWISARPHLRQEIESDPLFWFLKRKLTVLPVPFPFERTLELLNSESFLKLVPLLLVFSIMNSASLTGSLQEIVLYHEDIHKNDHIEEASLSSEQLKERENKQFNAFLSAIDPALQAIKAALQKRRQVLEKLKGLDFGADKTPPLEEMTRLLAHPHPKLARDSYILNINQLIEIQAKPSTFTLSNEPYLEVDPEWLTQFDTWALMWKQVDVLLDDDSGENRLFMTEKTNDSSTMLSSWVSLCHFSSANFETSDWTVQFISSILHDSSNEVAFSLFLDNCFNLLKHLRLNPEIVAELNSKYGEIIKIKEIVAVQKYEIVRKFLIEPYQLDRTQTKFMLRHPEARPFLMKNYSDAAQLRNLIDFTADDLLEFMAYAEHLQLEFFDALYTLRPEVIVEYLRRKPAPFVLNYPAKLVWSIFPSHFESEKFLRDLFEVIPITVLVEYSHDLRAHRMSVSTTEIMQQLDRMNLTPITYEAESLEKVIKWLINMEWNTLYLNIARRFRPELDTSELYCRYACSEFAQRVLLINYLSSLDYPAKDLAKIAKLPLGMQTLSNCFTNALLLKRSSNRQFTLTQFPDINPLVKFESLVEQVSTNVKRLTEMVNLYVTEPSIRQLYLEKLEIIEVFGAYYGEMNPISVESLRSIICKSTLPIYETSLVVRILEFMEYDRTSLKRTEIPPPGLFVEPSAAAKT